MRFFVLGILIMSNRWALVNADSVVDNVVIWGGGESMWPDKLTILLDDNELCAPGWTYDPAPMANPRFIEPVVDG